MSSSAESAVSIPPQHDLGGETFREKAKRKIVEEPLVTIGAVATVGALIMATKQFRRGDQRSMNHWLRFRVAAQGFTVLAICSYGFAIRNRRQAAKEAGDPATEIQPHTVRQQEKEREEFQKRLENAVKADKAEEEKYRKLKEQEGKGGVDWRQAWKEGILKKNKENDEKRIKPSERGSLNAFQQQRISVRRNSGSTAAWLNRQRRDPFVKNRGNYRSRSAFKLIQMDEQYHLFPKHQQDFVVCDLGSSPGGWSQACLELLGVPQPTTYAWDDEGSNDDENDNDYRAAKGGEREETQRQQEQIEQQLEQEEGDGEGFIGGIKVVGVDLIPTEPLLGARFLQGDFLDPTVQQKLHDLTGKQGADLILSDMAPNIRGNRIADIEASLELCRSVLAFAQRNLKVSDSRNPKSGTLIMKHFSGPAFEEFREKSLTPLFAKKIKYTKPEASRQNSSEAYFVCQGFKGPRLA
ncbi:2' O-ribose methyltransferase [Serendipita sp. 399]|nr:2' O-ribose methyltransferase [Serendipita sp. 399]